MRSAINVALHAKHNDLEIDRSFALNPSSVKTENNINKLLHYVH